MVTWSAGMAVMSETVNTNALRTSGVNSATKTSSIVGVVVGALLGARLVSFLLALEKAKLAPLLPPPEWLLLSLLLP